MGGHLRVAYFSGWFTGGGAGAVGTRVGSRCSRVLLCQLLKTAPANVRGSVRAGGAARRHTPGGAPVVKLDVLEPDGRRRRRRDTASPFSGGVKKRVAVSVRDHETQRKIKVHLE